MEFNNMLEKINYPSLSHRIVAESIRTGKENSTLMSDLMTISQITDRRQAYRIIQDLINKCGLVIGGSKIGRRGYYYPATKEEFEEIAFNFKQSIDSLNFRYENLISNYNKTVS